MAIRPSLTANRRLAASAMAFFAVPALALAQDDGGLRLMTAGRLDSVRFDLSGPFGLLMIGLAIFAATIAILHVRARKLWNEQFELQRATIADLQTKADRAALFLGAEPQFFVSWDGPKGTAELEGDPTVTGEGMTAPRVLSFTDWLPPHEASRLEAAIAALRNDGRGFQMQLNGRGGSLIEADGQAVSGRVVMRLRSVSGERLEVVRLADRLSRVNDTMEQLRVLLDAVPQPIWLRDRTGALTWVNAAYVSAVEGKDADDVIARSVNLLESQTLARIAEARAKGEPWQGSAQVVVAGDRRVMDVVDVVTTTGTSGGIAVDMTALEHVRRSFEGQSAAHVRTLDQLPTAIALFDASQRLTFHNRAFNALWQLDPRFLKSRPTDMELLDRLRADGKLPEQSDFRAWKQGLQQSFQSNETLEDIWLLPSGRSLRVVTSPSPAGGVTYMFNDITEQMHLAQDYNRLAEMQGETLDALTEGVALFGSNGRLRLRNPVFATLWGLKSEDLSAEMHIDEVSRLCPPEAQHVWADMKAAVCGLEDARVNKTHELRLEAGKVLQLSLTPLPEGASLITVEDVTSTVTAAQMLSERNKALESAAAFKSEFLHNVSFELRLPLTSVVGIAQLLATGTAGPLNERQRGYATDLMRATDSVLALINDILDLASIDSSGLDLKMGSVDLYKSIEEASAGLKDRLGGAGVNMRLRISQNVGGVMGDERRVRQILFNLLANAVACSDPGDTVLLTADRSDNRVVIRTIDRGSTALTGDPGFGLDSRRRMERGQSMRLSIVRSLVELHSGQLLVEARPDGLRQVVCILPAAVQGVQKAAG